MMTRHGFVLLTDLPKAGPYLDAVAAHGLAALVVAPPPRWPSEHATLAAAGSPDSPLHGVELALHAPRDTAGILARVAAWAAEVDVVGMFNSSELLVEPAGRLTDLLRLPGVSLRASQVCRDKHLQRLHLRDWSPRAELLTDGREPAAYPAVVKPLDLYSSIGVRLVRDRAALERHLAGLGPATPVLVEECVAGREFSVETLVVAGRPEFASVTAKRTTEDGGDFFVETAHTVPATGLTAAETALLTDTQAAVLRRLDFGTGMAHGEYRLRPDGTVVLMEVAARPPGDGLLQLYHLSTGRSVEAALVDVALGRPAGLPRPRRSARQVYLEHQPGRLDDVLSKVPGGPEPLWLAEHGMWPTPRPVPADAPAGLRELLVLHPRGAQLGLVTDSPGRSVTALLDAPGPAELDAYEAGLRRDITIVTDPGPVPAPRPEAGP